MKPVREKYVASKKGKIYSLILIIIAFSLIFVHPGFADNAADYLIELGQRYYVQGEYENALVEFNKVLILEPDNDQAKDYIQRIKAETAPPELKTKETPSLPSEPAKREPAPIKPPEPVPEESQKIIERELNRLELQEKDRQKAIEDSIKKATEAQAAKPEAVVPTEVSPKKTQEKPSAPLAKISGITQLSLGITSQDTYWKRADYNLNERNWRIINGNALNQKENTYDPRIFDRLKLNIDSGNNKEGLSLHSNLTVDPWSFIGKSNKVTVTAVNGDTAEFEVLYWSNSGYSIDQTIYTLRKGDSFSLPEIKVVGGRILPTTIRTTFGNTFNIPELELHKEFWPIREFWVDYKTDTNLNLRVFPIAYENQALISDDPLQLSGHKIYWEESPWLARWHPGIYNSSAGPPADFTKGWWDDALAFAVRDSDNTRLTALRGFNLNWAPDEYTDFSSTFASSKDLWQDYESFDSFPGAMRFKHNFQDTFSLGTVYTFHLGYNKTDLDYVNNVVGLDTALQPIKGLKLALEAATSRSKQDLSSDYDTRKRGNAFQASLMSAFGDEDILNKSYYEIKPKKEQSVFIKGQLTLTHMDEGFDPSLSTYRETRDDAFWGRHLHFRKPIAYIYSGMPNQYLKWDDIEPFRIGDGIDTRRNTIGLRLETSLFDSRILGLGDVRNVHYTDGKFLENVARTEWTFGITPKLTSKILALRHDLPHTKGGIDPFVFNPDNDLYYINSAIPDGQDPSLRTGSIGLKYDFIEQFSLYGIYERTNDSLLGADNFPRGVLNDHGFTTYTDEGMLFRREAPFLYSQGLFAVPPYPYFNIFKIGADIKPIDNLEIFLDWTRNEFNSAGQIDDNINHIGLEIQYMPTAKLGMYFKYVYSKWNDLNLMAAGGNDYYENHNNFFTELRYIISADDELTLQFGEGGRVPFGDIGAISSSSTDPFGGSLSTLDTQHIFRIYYRRKF